MKDKNQKQKGGDSSSNIQAENVNVYQGLSYKDIKEIATDVFKSNFIQLKDEAAQIASKRAEEITEKILNQLKDKNPESLGEFSEPGMQDALFTAQKEYAKSGDTELGDLLVDIIVDRVEATERNMLQIVLDESLHIAPKLTISQLDTLTLLFQLTRTRILSLSNFEEFKSYFRDEIFPFVDNLVQEYEHYSYLEYLRCGSIRTHIYGPFEQHIRNTYPGLFAKGFSKEKLKSEFEDLNSLKGLISTCFHDRNKFQIDALNNDDLEVRMKENGLSKKDRAKLEDLFHKTTMYNQEIKELLIQFDKQMEKIFDTWENSSFKNFELSSVGIAIAHANYRRRTGKTMDLSIWIK